ncbi:MAG: hypothetical protein ILA19_02140 [Bacilli bacterium]|nr:hypothetical protein [Bacilli bacterium]
MNIKNLDINIKKILTTLSAGALMLSFSGCGKNVVTNDSILDSSSSVTTKDINKESISDSSTLESSPKANNYDSIIKISNSTGIDSSELVLMIDRYSVYTKMTYEQSVKIVENNLDKIKNEYNNPKAGVMCVLFDYAIENNILRNNCPEDEMLRQETTNYEKESFMLEMCENFGMNDVEKNVSLSVFRTKMNTTTTNNIRDYNNFDDSTLPSGELCRYETPKYGLYEAFNVLKKHLDGAKDNGIYDSAGIINYLSQFYGGDDWIVNVTEVYNESQQGYPFGKQII